MWEVLVEKDTIYITEGGVRLKIGVARYRPNMEFARHEADRRNRDPSVRDFSLTPRLMQRYMQVGGWRLSRTMYQMGVVCDWREVKSLVGVIVAKTQRDYIPNPDCSIFSYFWRQIMWRVGHILAGRRWTDYKLLCLAEQTREPDDRSVLRSRYCSIKDDSEQKGQKHQPEVPLHCLDETRRFVIDRMFVDGMTLQQVGDLMGISRERVRQIKEDALHALRRRLGEAVGPREAYFKCHKCHNPATVVPAGEIRRAPPRSARRRGRPRLSGAKPYWQHLMDAVLSSPHPVEKKWLLDTVIERGGYSFSTYYNELRRMIRRGTLALVKRRNHATGLLERMISVAK